MHRQFPDALIRLEKPIATNVGLVHLDILVQLDSVLIAIELKYKTRKISVHVENENYSLRTHSAQNHGRYDFIKDICRLENISEAHTGSVGFAVLLTNESSYWRLMSDANAIDTAFRLHDGRVLSGDLSWRSGASAGTIKLREKPISLRAAYPLEWRVFSSLNTNNDPSFLYLVVPVNQA